MKIRSFLAMILVMIATGGGWIWGVQTMRGQKFPYDYVLNIWMDARQQLDPIEAESASITVPKSDDFISVMTSKGTI